MIGSPVKVEHLGSERLSTVVCTKQFVRTGALEGREVILQPIKY
jgi:hypothetical protein